MEYYYDYFREELPNASEADIDKLVSRLEDLVSDATADYCQELIANFQYGL